MATTTNATTSVSLVSVATGYYQNQASVFSQVLGVNNYILQLNGTLQTRPVITFNTQDLVNASGLTSATQITQLKFIYTATGATGSFGSELRGTPIVSSSDNATTINSNWTIQSSNIAFTDTNISTSSGTNNILINTPGLDDFKSQFTSSGLWSIAAVFTSSFGNFSVTLSNVSLEITYNVIANTALSFRKPTKNDIIVQDNKNKQTALLLSTIQHTSMFISGVKNIVPNHSVTWYQIYEDHVPPSGKPLISLTSNTKINKSSNLLKLTKNELQIILRFNTKYKMRTRLLGSNGWSSWSNFKKFKTRSKNYF